MPKDRPKLAPAIYDAIPEKGRYERDVLNDFLMRASLREIEAALDWLCVRHYLRRCGDVTRPIYVRREHASVRYTNIRPVTGEDVLLAMHQNFTQESQT